MSQFNKDCLVDSYNRKIDYLRISVTDRCNLKCIYCMPASGIIHKPQNKILSFEQIYKIIKVAVDLGIRKVRLTGGEPLVRKDLPILIERLRSIDLLKEICLTTNGIYLIHYAHTLKKAGLDRVNISLDTLNPERFQKITRSENLKAVLEGIEIAFSAGLYPVKINTVLLRGFNEKEIIDFVKLTQNQPLNIRFIEYMPINLDYVFGKNVFFSCTEAKEICLRLGNLIPINDGLNGTARVFRIEGFCGTIGFISPISEPFCFSCNKLRLTSDGYIKSCLHSVGSLHLKAALDKGADEECLALLIKEAVALKPQAHNLLDTPLGFGYQDFSMCQIGG